MPTISSNDTTTPLRERDLALFYTSGHDDLVRRFYVPCMASACRYDRAVGYFRSSIFGLVGEAFADFANRGGRARLVCSPDLTEQDAIAIRDGYEAREIIDAAMMRDLDELVSRPDGVTATTFLATLVAMGSLEVKVAVKRAQGIFHHKVGLFTDDAGDTVSFVGSANESWAAWSLYGNEESFEVFRSWAPGDDVRVAAHQEFFESVWSGDAPQIDVYDLPDAFRQRLLTYAADTGIDALPGLISLRQMPTALSPLPELFEHQANALLDWEARSHRGLLEHATGSGKTITALSAAHRWVHSGRPVLIVVPSDLLLQQWILQTEHYLSDLDPAIVVAGGGRSKASWAEVLAAFTRPGEQRRIVIATIQTASTDDFLSRLPDPSELLVIIDEAHRAGSSQNSRVLTIEADGRLGLSATPQRAGDPDGTALIQSYFERTLDPIYGLKDAIDDDRLCQYTYYVHPVQLTVDEEERWEKLSKEISREIARARTEDGVFPKSPRIDHLLIQRARIIKQAHNKSGLAVRVLDDRFREGQTWLVYCDDRTQLDNVCLLLRERGLPVYEYHSAMDGDREQTMRHYEQQGGVMVAIRCLDEGVDIPRISHALILASSRNPREFIQRRGRVLRKDGSKIVAEIHDALVIPGDGSEDGVGAQMARPELARAALFAKDALNSATHVELVSLASRLGIELATEAERGDEDDS